MELDAFDSGITLGDNDSDDGLGLLLPPRLTKKGLRGHLRPFNNWLSVKEAGVKTFFADKSSEVKIFLYTIVCFAWIAYVIIACTMNFARARHLIYFTGLVAFCVMYWLVKKLFGHVIVKYIFEPIQTHVEKHCTVLKWISVLLFTGGLLAWLIYDTIDEPERLISLAGLVIYVFIGFLFSKDRCEIRWRPIIWGFVLQFIFGLVMLRTYIGYEVFKWIADIIQEFLGFSSGGARFVFGDLHQFIFTLIPVLVFVSSFIYCFYYLGLIQVPISKIAWLLKITMGTTTGESFNAAANIFIGLAEAPLLIRPFLQEMTESELHAVLTGGFATIAGTVFAVYVSFGISAHHLLTASVMSAPAALAMSKLMCPEVEEPDADRDDIPSGATDEKNIFEAIAVGASMSIGLVANILVMLIAFLSFLACANAIFGWLGSMVGVPQFSFEYICSYVFMPFAYIMGVSWDDSFEVAELLGVKTFLNEFFAYKKLSVFIKNRVDGRGISLTRRSEVITTYALCGFANFSSMGIQLGTLGALAPGKIAILSKLVFRALCAGTLACFMTACVAGLLYNDQQFLIPPNNHNISSSPFNNTII